MTTSKGQALEDLIGQWRAYVRRRRATGGPVVEELERRLRDQVAALTAANLAEDEAFLVAVGRMGGLDPLSRDFAREHAGRLWQQLVIDREGTEGESRTAGIEMLVVLGLAIAAALAIKAPAPFGLPIRGHEPFYARNASLFVLPLLAGYFAWKRGLGPGRCAWLALPFAAGAVFANVFPFQQGSHTEVLTALHLPIALWLAVGVAYTGRSGWFAGGRRMDFVRFSGELFIFYTLIALGGGVLTAFTMTIFRAIEVDAGWLAQDWLLPCGAMGAVIVGSWLVEARQGVIENIAPVLTRLFTPLFAVILLAFLATMAWTGHPIRVDRELLIGFDLLLVVVVGLVLYAASAREPGAPPGLFDGLQLLLVVSALIVDGLALGAIAARISDFGFTPNRVAALGENLVLLVNLTRSAWLSAGFLRGARPFADLERWQVDYLPVYAAWASLVVVMFPPLFGYA